MLKVIKGDITTLAIDVIVNAANTTLLGGGGVDGAIHRAAGPDLLAECKLLNGCSTGDAKITKGYNLKAAWVIHTVGPVWNGGDKNEALLLQSCYQKSLVLALHNTLNSIAFPCISTGVYRYPKSEACEIAISTVTDFLSNNILPSEVVFVCFDDESFQLYLEKLKMF